MVGIVNRRAPVIEHPMLVEGVVEARAYQVMAFLDAMSDSTLLVLPTGYGKTAVQWLMMADVLHRGVRSFSSHRPMVWWTNNDEWPRRCSPSPHRRWWS